MFQLCLCSHACFNYVGAVMHVSIIFVRSCMFQLCRCSHACCNYVCAVMLQLCLCSHARCNYVCAVMHVAIMSVKSCLLQLCRCSHAFYNYVVVVTHVVIMSVNSWMLQLGWCSHACCNCDDAVCVSQLWRCSHACCNYDGAVRYVTHVHAMSGRKGSAHVLCAGGIGFDFRDWFSVRNLTCSGAHGARPCKRVGLAAYQLDLPSLTPLSVADGQLQYHNCKQLLIEPTNSGREFSSVGLQARPSIAAGLGLPGILHTCGWFLWMIHS